MEDDLKPMATRGRARSWSPPSLADAATVCGEEEYDSDDGAPILFDACRFPRPGEDFLDCALGEEPWQAASEASCQSRLRLVGEVGALKRLFSLPLRSAGEAVCLHRIGDCLIALEVPEDARGPDDYTASVCTSAPTAYAPPSMRSQVRVEGDTVRVYPRIDSAEPLDFEAPDGVTSRVGACCEWRVREGLSLMAVTPQPQVPRPRSHSCDLVDLRSNPPRLMGTDDWLGGDVDEFGSLTGIDMTSSRSRWPSPTRARWPSPPAYHKRVTENRAAVRVVQLSDNLDTDDIVDSWLSCCLLGSPTLLCFFVDVSGVFRGCRYVAAGEVPNLRRIAKAYHPNQRCLSTSSAAESSATMHSDEECDLEAFDPKALREMSHSLLEKLIDRLDHDGGQCLVVANPLGIHFLNASLQTRHDGNDGGDDVDDDQDEKLQPLMLMDVPELLPGFERQTSSSSTTPTKNAQSFAEESPEKPSPPKTTEDDFTVGARLRRAHMTQALLLYHAAVRLASARLPQESAPGTLKDVPSGSRWTAKSCRHPLRVRQMMFHAVRALRAAIAVPNEGSTEIGPDNGGAPPFRRRFLLLLASAFEFVADTFLAEDSQNNDALDIARQISALRHLDKSSAALSQYMETAPCSQNDVTQSIQRLEERLLAKRANAHLCLARLRQRSPWSADMPGYFSKGVAVRELDIAEQLLLHPQRVTQPARSLGPHESSLLASIAKWKADLLYELVTLSAPNGFACTEVDHQLKLYLEAQQLDLNDSPQPLPLQRERWLQSIISLTLRSLHHLSSVPPEVVGDLQAQARALLARAYGDLGHIYASTGRYTKAMTHAKQGIELFSATHDKLHASTLQLWLCRLQLRLAVPHASSTGANANTGSLLDEAALFRGLSAVNKAEDSACAQVVASLQKVLKTLENTDADERRIQVELQTLLGRVILRQGLSRMARSTPFGVVCGLCEEDSALPSMLDILQSGDAVGLDAVKEAVELLLQASAYFRDAGEEKLNGIAHACLAAAYFRGRTDGRVHRLALTHCQHALENLLDCGHSGSNMSPLRLAVQLLEARAMRRTTNKGGSASSLRVSDASAAAALCNIALSCQLREERSERRPSAENIQDREEEEDEEEDHRQRTAVPPSVLAGDEQRLPVMSYVRQELGDLLLRLLRGNERQEGSGRELKGLYGALVTAWHTDAGQIQALTALRDYMNGVDGPNG